MTAQATKRVEELVLWIIAEMWIAALVVASMLFVGVVGTQALGRQVRRQVRDLRTRHAQAARELTGTV